MSKVHVLTTNFSTGEVSPKIHGRTDIQRYFSGLKRLAGAIPLRQGGAIRAPGTRYVKDAGHPIGGDEGILLPFIFDKNTTYVLEMWPAVLANSNLRFYYGSDPNIGPVMDSTPAHYTIIAPYQVGQLKDIRYTQRANTMILAHSAVFPQRLQRFANALWAIGNLPVTVFPSSEFGDKPVANITLSAASGVGVTVTASAASFLASDVGRQIEAGTGLLTITAFTSTTVVVGTTVRDFDALTYASQLWTLTDSPQTQLTPSVVGPDGAAITLTLAANGWRSTDVGKYVKLNGGIAEITGYTSATIVTGLVRRILTATTPAEAGAWTLEEKSWSTARGFPQSVTTYQQRVVFGGTTSQPNTIWGSAIGDISNFAVGVNTDDAFEFTLDSGTSDLIQHLESLRSLLGLTSSAEHSLRGASGALSTTSVDATANTFYGAGIVRPVKVGYEMLFSLFAGMQLRNYSYDFSTDSYQSADVSELADHLLLSGISRMAFAKEPYQILWIVMADGTLASMTYDANTEVQMRGWASQPANGTYLDVCSVPGAAGDQVWFRTKRRINGVDKYFIEYQDYAVNTHAALVQTTGLPLSAITTGIAHLLGQTVDILLDGIAQPQQVAANPLNFARAATSRIEVGLPYVSTLIPLRPEFQQDGSSQGRATSINEAVLRVIESRGLKVNDQVLKGKDFGVGVLDQPPVVRNEDLAVTSIGWSRRGDDDLIVITQDQPYFFHILALVRECTIN